MKKAFLALIAIAVVLAVVSTKHARREERSHARGPAVTAQAGSPTPQGAAASPTDSVSTIPEPAPVEGALDVAKAMQQALAPRQKYIEKYGLHSKAAKIDPAMQDAFEGSPEYRSGVQSHEKAAALEKAGHGAEADAAYQETIRYFLEAIRRHSEADVTPAVFRIGAISARHLTRPDRRTAYFCLRYVQEASPGSKLAMFTGLLNEIRASGQISTQEMADLDKTVQRLVASSGGFDTGAMPQGEKR
jgi:hypothetical protein